MVFYVFGGCVNGGNITPKDVITTFSKVTYNVY